MTKIFVGTEVLRTKAAIKQLERNIAFLQFRLRQITSDRDQADQAKAFYSKKLESQRSLLGWLTKVSGHTAGAK